MKGYIYIIRESGKGFLKIGRSINPLKRLGNLQVGTPHNLSIVLSKASSMPEVHEINIHKILNKHHIRGEWFSCSEKEAIDAVDSITDGERAVTESLYLVKWNCDGPKSRIVYGKKNARSLKTHMKGTIYQCDEDGNRLTKAARRNRMR